MAKTYTAAGSATAGQVYTASAHNVIVTDVNNLIVPPLVRARRAAVLSVANGVIQAVNFDTEDIDTDGMFTPTARLVTVQTAGVYAITATVSFAGNATGNRSVIIYKNPTFSGSGDSSTIASGTAIGKSAHTQASSTDANTCASTIYDFAVNDTIAVGCFQNSGGALNTDSVANPYIVQLCAHWIGRTS